MRGFCTAQRFYLASPWQFLCRLLLLHTSRSGDAQDLLDSLNSRLIISVFFSHKDISTFEKNLFNLFSIFDLFLDRLIVLPYTVFRKEIPVLIKVAKDSKEGRDTSIF